MPHSLRVRLKNLQRKGELTEKDIDRIFKALEQEPCDDVVSRQAVLDGIEELKQSPWATDKRGNGFEYLITEALDMVAFLCVKQEPSVRPQEQTGQFAEWVAREIFDDMWEYNKDAFAEIACRKLAKLGIVREKGNEWELVEPQEGSEE